MKLRLVSFLLFPIAIGCSSQLTVLTEKIEYIQPIDFVAEKQIESSELVVVHVDADDADDAVEAVEEEVDVAIVRIEQELQDIEEFDETMTPVFVGIPVTVEALVGQVNGRPIYANKVLEPVADQIQAASKNMKRTEFADKIHAALYTETDQMGTKIRSGRMYELVITDLLLSEAMSGMSKEQSFGLLAIVGQMRDNLASSQGGSQTQLRHDLEQQVGVSVEKFLELQRDQILIDALYQQRIWPKVNVTWRDIQREFEQVSLGEEVVISEVDIDRTEKILAALQTGMPLGSIPEARGSVTLGMIRIKSEDPKVLDVKEAFENGQSFQEVASFVGVANDGVWDTFEMGLGGIGDITVGPKIKEHLIDVEEGDIIEPFELGTSTVWLAVLEVREPVSLYNRRIQIALNNALRWVQFSREKDRYVESLWGEGSLDAVESMADRVTNIAVRRYQR